MISTKGRYAIRFMIDLAEQASDLPVPLDAISERQDISKKYLEIVVKLLVQNNLVKGTSGKGGGYKLLRSPEEYTIREILESTEGSLATVACLKDETADCPRKNKCLTLPMWKKYDEMIGDFFTNITLDDLIKGNI